MGTAFKFSREKSYQVIAVQAVHSILTAIEEAKNRDGNYPKFTVTVTGSITESFDIPADNVPEIIEVLKLSTIDDD